MFYVCKFLVVFQLVFPIQYTLLELSREAMKSCSYVLFESNFVDLCTHQ
jgi:hypothetical protein